MKHLRILADENAHEAFKNSDEYVTPYVCYLKNIKGTRIKTFVKPTPALVGDVAYWDGSKVKTISKDKWNTSLGTPVGVVVIPTGFAPDGKARIVGLSYVDKEGNASNTYVGMTWGLSGVLDDTSLINYTKVPATDNTGNISTGSTNNGYLPSDKFTGATSFVDSKTKYAGGTPMLPSPYLGEAPNPDYYKELEGDNALSDFNGLSNTQTLVGLGADYVAANACWKYKDGVSNLQWYLPALGELGYLMPRFNEINAVIATVTGSIPLENIELWSSTENKYNHAYVLRLSYGYLIPATKTGKYTYVRPFAIL